MAKKPYGYVIYDGPSLIDGEPIVVIVNALKASRNSKTGNMVQTYILRKDVHPVDANRTGSDYSICGDCKHRGDGTGKQRSCYVILGHGPSTTYKAYQRGIYPHANPSYVSDIVAGRMVRLGAYGDPAAVPMYVWRALTAKAEGWTGYTHQWRKLSMSPDYPNADPRLHLAQKYLMASVDNKAELYEAHLMGWRTFRVGTDKLLPTSPIKEVVCPASAEAGKKTQCEACRACMGTSAKANVSIIIAPHGIGAKYAA